MRLMRSRLTVALPARAAALLTATALFAGGCQFIAGVRTDGELLGGSAGSTTTTAGGTGGVGGTGGTTTPPCQKTDDCGDPASVCLAGECVQPKCTPNGEAVTLFEAADLGGNQIDTKGVYLAADGDRIAVIVRDPMGSRLLARSWTNNVVNPVGVIVEAQLGGDSRFDTAEVVGAEVRVYGLLSGSPGHVAFPSQGGVHGTATTVSYPALPANCQPPNSGPDRINYDHLGGVTRFAVQCSGSTDRYIYLGTDSDTAVLAQTTPNASNISLRGYLDGADGTQLLVLSLNDTESYVSFGKDATELATYSPLKLSADPNTLSFIGDPMRGPDGSYGLIGATASSIDASGAIWAGLIPDYASFSEVPPTGAAPLLTFDKPIFGDLARVAVSPGGFFTAGASPDTKSVVFVWIDPTAKTLLIPFTPGYTLPAGSTAKIVGASVVRTALDLDVAWIELDNGTMSVRGQRFYCSY